MRRAHAALVVAALVAPATIVRAQAPDEGVQHFRTGVRLYKDGNFTGALAEFELAQKLHPTASALSNIALCQKALFRYAEAIGTLEQMQKEYGPSLSADDSRVAADAIAELRALVTTLTVVVTPADATVSIDGRAVAGGAERHLDVNVGEHRLLVEAPGYRHVDQVVSVAGKEKRVEIALVADAGTVTVTTDDPEAAIYVDGKEGAYGKWKGTVSAGSTHTITVFKPGFNPTTYQVTVQTGESKDVKAAVGERFRGPFAPPTPFPYVRPVASDRRSGPYFVVGATSYQLSTQPDGFAVDGSTKPGGTYFGARAGWLLVHNIGIEAVFEGGQHSTGACYNPNGDCNADNKNVNYSYDLLGYRFGVAGRYITGGETFRFLADLGFGAAYHKLTITQHPGVTDKSPPPIGSGASVGGAVFGDIGLEISITRVIIDGVLSFAADGVNGISINGQKAYTATPGTAGFGGVGVRVGYAFW